MIDIAAGSAELGVNVPEFNRRFKDEYPWTLHDHVLPVGLVFYVDVMSVVLNMNNPVSRSPLQIPLAWLFVFEVHMISNVEGWVVSGYSVLRGCESVLVQCFLCYC